jgi:hypothetical protein
MTNLFLDAPSSLYSILYLMISMTKQTATASEQKKLRENGKKDRIFWPAKPDNGAPVRV